MGSETDHFADPKIHVRFIKKTVRAESLPPEFHGQDFVGPPILSPRKLLTQGRGHTNDTENAQNEAKRTAVHIQYIFMVSLGLYLKSKIESGRSVFQLQIKYSKMLRLVAIICNSIISKINSQIMLIMSSFVPRSTNL